MIQIKFPNWKRTFEGSKIESPNWKRTFGGSKIESYEFNFYLTVSYWSWLYFFIFIFLFFYFFILWRRFDNFENPRTTTCVAAIQIKRQSPTDFSIIIIMTIFLFLFLFFYFYFYSFIFIFIFILWRRFDNFENPRTTTCVAAIQR